MTTDQPAGGAPTSPNVAALVDAIDARARQAGNEGASAVVQRMLGSVTEVLTSIQDRLDHVEEALTSGSGGGGGVVVEAVQTGLASFNARLARLEEAFVQAVDESGSGTQAVVDEVRTAVTRALEESAPKSSGGIDLDPSTRDALTRVEAALAAMGNRLDGLEERLVSALQPHAGVADTSVDLSTLDLTASLAPVLERLDHVERRLMESPRAVSSSIEAAFEVVQVRIAGLEQLLRGRSTERVDPAPAVRVALAPVVERMDELDASQRSTAARHHESIGRVEAALAGLPGRFTSLEERVWAVVSSLTEGSGAAVDATLLTRLEEAVDRLDRDETSARLVKLVEERLSAGLRAMTERTDEVRRAVDHLAKSAEASSSSSDDGALDDVVASLRALQSATRAVPDDVAGALGARLVPMGDRLSALDARLDALQELLSLPPSSVPDHTDVIAELAVGLRAVRADVQELAARPAATASSSPADVSGLVEQVNAAVRREAELLTQRVAALAVGVEASRVLLEQHLRETENSIGRKAGEVTRRLAADFGISSRRTGPGGRRDPRELGPG